MLIKDLPTAALRDKYAEYLSKGINPLGPAVDACKTDQSLLFWIYIHNKQWEKARELQPDLFKPLPGKPHIKIRETSAGGFWINQFCNGPLNLEIMLWAESINPKTLPTQGEAARAWHNYRRAV